MTEATYGRGQLEWALWRGFAGIGVSKQDVPAIFRTRIKRLLDIDRDLDLGDVEVPPDADYAFAPPPDSGTETGYRAVDGFCLAVALDLLDAGFKQSEVVFLMRYVRPDLEQRFPSLLTPPSLIDRQLYRARDYPGLPSWGDGPSALADRRVFMILRKVELTELIPAPGHAAGPVFLEPVFCDGMAALGEALDDLMPLRRRSVTIVELAAAAQAIAAWLPKAPVIRRGRPSTRPAKP